MKQLYSKDTYYSVEVWSSKYKRYVGWGIEYSTKEKALDVLREYLQDCLSIHAKYPDETMYIEQYKSYSSKPVKIKSYTLETYITKHEDELEEVK